MQDQPRQQLHGSLGTFDTLNDHPARRSAFAGIEGSNTDVTEAVFSNLSKRARQTIEEEMQFMSGVQESRILQARNSIAEIIARIDMESEG